MPLNSGRYYRMAAMFRKLPGPVLTQVKRRSVSTD
jgi:hypothetical protein